MKKLTLHILAISLLSLFSVASCGYDQVNSFPSIATGVYDGLLTFSKQDSLGSLSDRTLGVFLEKKDGVASLELSIFYPGQVSTQHSLFPLDSELGEKFQPLSLEIAKQSFFLIEENSKNSSAQQYSGIIKSKGGDSLGFWRIFPSKQQDVDPASSSYMSYQIDSEKFNAWLALQARYQVALGQLRVASEISVSLEGEVAYLQKTLNSPELLQEKGVSKLEETKQALASTQEEISELDALIEKGLKGIKQVQRITKLGRSLELSRRVASRESQWYQVNWSDGRSDESMESKIARKMNIDLRLLDQKTTRALEIRRLKSQIAAEKAKIRNLHKQKKRKIEDAEQEKKQPWWQRWDTVIG